MIKDKSLELYPNLDGAKYLEYSSDDTPLPKGLTITYSNVVVPIQGGKPSVLRQFKGSWAWHMGSSFHSGFDTPEAAVQHFISLEDYMKDKGKDKHG